jgi:hypothetical protein
MFGAEGYGAFWIIQEMIAASLTPEKPTDATIRGAVSEIAATCGISVKKFKNLVIFLSKCDENLADNPIYNKVSIEGGMVTIECRKLLKRADNYFNKNKKG